MEMAEKGMTPRTVQVREELARLQSEVSRAIDAVGEIEVRLKPVLRLEEPQVNPELSDVSGERVELALEIAEQADKVGHLASRLISVLGRLEL